MRRLVLRGFLQRKLRVVLTAIAIALGVALMAGTYILTDTINQSFAGIFKTAAKGDTRRRLADRDARARKERRRIADHRGDAQAGARRAGRRRSRRRHLHAGNVPRPQAQTPDQRRRARVHRRGAAQALRVVRADRGALSRRRRRSRDRRSDGLAPRPEGRPADDRRRRRACQALHDRRHPQVRRRAVLRRRGHRGAHAGRGAARGRGDGALRPDRRRRARPA